MVSLPTGRVCMKIAGRESGKYCVVLKKENEAFALVTGPKILTGVKKRRCNVEHLEPLPHTLEINENSSDEEIIAAYRKAGLVTKFGLKLPSAAEVKAEKAKPPKEEKKEKQKEKPKEKSKEEKGKKEKKK
jgi:large subunit ribosomal protein L14e